MRKKRASQRSLFDAGYPDHEMGRTLERVSLTLDGHPEFLDWIEVELGRGRSSATGTPLRSRLPAPGPATAVSRRQGAVPGSLAAHFRGGM